MANPQSPSGDDKQPPASTNGSAPLKPRATIVMKNPNANPGSQPRIPVPTGGPSGSVRAPAVRPAPSQRRPAVDREALGLSAARPSEMIEGLEEAAKRAEALATREEAKRKSGGKMAANIALHVDDTGRKWALWVRLGIVVLLLAAGGVGAWMFITANRQKIGAREGMEKIRVMLNFMGRSLELMEPFKEGETITAQAAKEKLAKHLETELEAVSKRIEQSRSAGRNPDKKDVELRGNIDDLLKRDFKDPWDKPYQFAVEGDDLTVSAVSAAEGTPSDPVKTRIREGSVSKPPEKEESTEKK